MREWKFAPLLLAVIATTTVGAPAARAEMPHITASPGQPPVDNGSTSPIAPTGPAAGSAAAPTPSVAPANVTAPKLVWEDCESGGKPKATGLHCAELAVPLNHADPGREISLAVVRQPATNPKRRIGSLVYNPGGPGTSGVSAVANSAKSKKPYFGKALRERFDIVGFDPRGVEFSEPGVRCLTDAERKAAYATDVSPYKPTAVQRERIVRKAQEFATKCGKKNDADLLRHMSTVDVARDLELLRAALRDEKLTMLGASYGTLIAQTYASLFPGKVRALALDAVVDPDVWLSPRIAVEQSAAVEQTLNAYFQSCVEAGSACPFGAGKPDQAFDRLVKRLETKPVRVVEQKTKAERSVDGFTVILAAYRAMGSAQALWPVLTNALVAAERGEFSTLLALNDGGSGEQNSKLGNGDDNDAVHCVDQRAPETSVDAYHRLNDEAATVAPRLGPVFGYTLLPCAFWPVPSTGAMNIPLDAKGAPPILLIGGTLDPLTPYHWAQAVARKMDSAVLITHRGVGHGAYGREGSNPYLNAAVERYLITGETPLEGTVYGQTPPASAALPVEETDAEVKKTAAPIAKPPTKPSSPSPSSTPEVVDDTPVVKTASEPKGLPLTGASVATLVGIAVLLVAAGAAAFITARRRRTRFTA